MKSLTQFQFRKTRSKAAFTMVEIALSLAIIGFALVAIIGILPVGMNVQKDNREETLVNFDAGYLMDAIRSGARGQDELTNYVMNITNYFYFCNNQGVPSGRAHLNWYTTNQFQVDGGAVQNNSFLTNGSNIIGLLTIPKYIPAQNGNYYSNYTTADIRPITGALVDQGVSQASRDFAFRYRLYPEIIPSSDYAYVSATDPWENFGAPTQIPRINNTNDPVGLAVAKNLQYNFYQIRLRFRWPVLARGQLGNSHLIFRSAASGAITNMGGPPGSVISSAYIQPRTYLPQLP